ncbi:hypothetical protein H8R02_28450 [Ramlibacter sp. GTP1]|uniref:Uncharacterized protein n=1 Tax=Ramlibacter albus TaxID=2079448 RepID=A0A923S5C5_9BURK|nr:hypothetical protein [Ramlibacter albus]
MAITSSCARLPVKLPLKEGEVSLVMAPSASGPASSGGSSASIWSMLTVTPSGSAPEAWVSIRTVRLSTWPSLPAASTTLTL